MVVIVSEAGVSVKVFVGKFAVLTADRYISDLVDGGVVVLIWW
jgi:hypothetical protein